ncbi:MAG TPA: condensation domain-containing protein [Candidatus Angelobacter sp.]
MQATTKIEDVSGSELSFAEELIWQAEFNGPMALPFFDCARSLYLALQLQGPLNQEALKHSLYTVVQRHHVLRSRFITQNGQPIRLMSPTPSFSFTAIDRQTLPPKNPDEIVADDIKPLLECPFVLARGPLLRAVLVSSSCHEHILAVAVHHIVFDRWSLRLLELELRQFYSACVIGTKTDAKPVPLQYQDYVRWQREQLNSERARILKKYWTDKLSGLPDLILPCDGAMGPVISARSGSSWFTISPEEVSGLIALSRRGRTTLAATMLAIFKLFLYRLSGMNDIAVGVPLSDRRRPEFEEVIGLFMNVVVVRTSIPNTMTFLDLLDRVRHGLVDACLHQDLPHGYLQRIIPNRPLYKVVFNFMPPLPSADSELAGLHAKHLPIAVELHSVADISLLLCHEAGALLCRLVYKSDLFSETSGRNFASQIQTLIKTILHSPQNCIDTYCLEQAHLRSPVSIGRPSE